jgi:hypothetical protein
MHDMQVLVPFGKKAMANHKELRTSLYGMDAEDTACVSKVSAVVPCGLQRLGPDSAVGFRVLK